jgi:GT2 family glycosyltransferase
MPSAPISQLAVGVVLYENSRAQLERLLASLSSCRAEPGSPSFDVLWLDNSPTPDNVALAASLGVHEVARAGSNLGFGAGHNAMMRKAFSDPRVGAYVCVNPDGALHPACLAELVAEAARWARPGLVEALQFPDEHPKHYDPATHATDWCSGCVLLVTRALYERIGGYDENIFLYCEDVDLSWRARAAGFDIALAPRALVHHFVGDREPGGNATREMLRAGVYLGEKWGGHDFARVCRREYSLLTGKAPQTARAEPMPREAQKVAHFKDMFHFTKVRW